MGQRLAGSARRFDHDDRPATTSLNLLASHDGFTLMDVVSYKERHNAANGEGSRDGHSDNRSDNLGHEGPTDDPRITALRALRRRNMMATLLFSQGTPMILAGDEFGNSQRGNNNAYCQDNEIGWLNWDEGDEDFLAFCRKLTAFRRDHPILRQNRFLHSRQRLIDDKPDLYWWTAEGTPMTSADWTDPGRHHLCAELRTASGTPEYARLEYAIFLALNAGAGRTVVLPDPPEGRRWVRHIDTARPERAPKPVRSRIRVAGHSVVALVQEGVGDR